MNTKEHIKSKIIAKYPDIKFEILWEEFIKFITISSLEKIPKFFPCSKEIDDLWHECILETSFYFDLCHSIANCYLHHTGITYQDYSKDKTFDELNNEEMSWISSYLNNYGNFNEETIIFWLVAQRQMQLHNINYNDLNKIFKKSVEIEKKENYIKNKWLKVSYFSVFLAAQDYNIYFCENINLLEDIDKNKTRLMPKPCLVKFS